MNRRTSSWITVYGTLVASLALLLAPSSFAAIDLDGNGVSDIWEILYLYPGSTELNADPDGDGVSNFAESVWGTNPMHPDRPAHGFSLAYNPQTDSVDVTWPGMKGKRYQLQSRTSFGAESWDNDGPPLDGNGSVLAVSHSPSSITKMFRLQVTDKPSLHEGVSEWEAITIGLSPSGTKATGGGGTTTLFDPNLIVTVLATKPFISEDNLAEPGVFTITRAASDAVSSNKVLMVGYTVSGTATGISDHSRSNGWISMPAGVTNVAITVPLKPDADLESSESVNLALTWILRMDAGGPTSIQPGSPSVATVIITDTTAPTGTGLLAQYYDTSSTTYANAANFAPAQLKVTRVDPAVDFDWIYGTPNATTRLTSPDNYSVTWEGYLSNSTTGDFQFQLDADDRARVLVNGVQVLEQGWDTPATSGFKQSGNINLVAPAIPADRHRLTVQFVEHTNNATCRLQWRLVSGTFVNIPSTNVFTTNTGVTNGWLTTYYADTNFFTAPVAGFETNSAVTLNNNGIWGAGTPDSSLILPETFSARWTGQLQPQFSEDYTFVVNADDGVKLWINGQLQTLRVGATASSASTYSYDSVTGNMVVTHANIPAGSFIVGETARVDPTSGNVTGAYADYVVTAVSGNTFTVNLGVGAFTTGTGNCNVEWLNKPINDWAVLSNVDRYVRLPMIAGVRYDIRLEYFENTGYARCQLYWYSPSQPKQIIPSNRLYPATVAQAPATFVGESEATALVGVPFAWTIPGNNGSTVILSNTPAWLTFSSGALSGTPPPGSAREYQIQIRTDGPSGFGMSVLNLHVLDNTATPILREYWNGVGGTSVSAIPVGTAPTGTANLSSLEAPSNFGDDYGARIRGYITAPVTGNYYFWIAANNTAELWIANDDEPVNAFKRAWVTTGNATPQTWNGAASQRSPWLALEGGKKYYLEVLHKAGTGAGDNLAVGWAKPGQPTNAPSQVVPGSVLSPYVAPAPGSTPGTLYISTMLAQNGAVSSGVGTSTLRLSEDEIYGYMRYTFSGLTGPISSQHIHTDPYLTHPSTIVYDIDTPATPGDGLITNPSDPNYGAHRWTITAVGTLSAADIREIIKQGKAYINLHTATYPNGEIRGNYTLANGSRTFSTPPAPPAWADDHATDNGAVRFLTQATYGPNIADIAALKAMTSYEAWIDDQFTKTASRQLPEVLARELSDAGGGAQFNETLTFNAWWRNSITGTDQLLQRVAFALSEIHVVSAQGPLDNRAEALSYFYDKLADNAFGNFRAILEDTTLTPAMGRYLDMLRNDKPDQSVGRIPNENYAREIKQLFSVGLYRLWPDGTLILNSKDAPIDSYTQREIVGLAHVFTGWDYGYDGAFRTTIGATTDWMRQMREIPARHFTGTKRILNNEVLPGLPTVGGQPLDPFATHNTTHYNDPAYQALPAQELDAAHDQLFNHPNTGPFICRQLIQRMVTSNPSRDYLYRVVQKFNDNGSGVRGDMKAVIKAILLDYEARSSTAAAVPAYGKQREPVMRVASPARAFRVAGAAGTYSQSGSHVITITAANKLTNGNTVFLEFPRAGAFVQGDITPSSEAYTVLSSPLPTPTSFSVNAKGWTGINGSSGAVTGTYSQTGGSSTITITISGHWLPAGRMAYLDFTTASTGPALADGVYIAATSTSTSDSVAGTTFTITGLDTTARTGNLRMVRFQGSFTVSNSGLAAPNEKRITFDTTSVGIADHHLVPGDLVFQNFTTGNPQPLDATFTVESVPDANTFTVLTNTAAVGGGNDSDNGMWMFPLVSQPTTRTGSVNVLPGTFNMGLTDSDLSQTPLNSPTVFNFFLPDYKFPGALASQGITTPEFQDTAETTVIRQGNFFYNGIFNPANSNGVSSFKTGSHALILDLSPWMANANSSAGTVGEVLGAGPQPTQPWTSDANLGTLIDRLNTMLVAGQLSAGAKTVIQNFLYRQIASIGTGNPCTITLVGHGFKTGDTNTITGVSGGTFSPTINGTFTITVTGPDTFTVPVNCSSLAGLGLANSSISAVPYNNTTTTDAHKRDRVRAIIHLILTSPDFLIQR